MALLFWADPELAVEIQEEKKQLVGQILDLQNTLDGKTAFRIPSDVSSVAMPQLCYINGNRFLDNPSPVPRYSFYTVEHF